MGWLSRTTGCVFLLTISSQAEAGARIAYPTASQMYALLDSDVQVTSGTVQAKAPIVDSAPAADTSDPMPVLPPARPSFVATGVGFVPSARDYGMSPLDAAVRLPVLDARINAFWSIRQELTAELFGAAPLTGSQRHFVTAEILAYLAYHEARGVLVRTRRPDGVFLWSMDEQPEVAT